MLALRRVFDVEALKSERKTGEQCMQLKQKETPCSTRNLRLEIAADASINLVKAYNETGEQCVDLTVPCIKQLSFSCTYMYTSLRNGEGSLRPTAGAAGRHGLRRVR